MLRQLSQSFGYQNVIARLAVFSMCLLALALCLSPASTNAASIFFENFQGFTSFPSSQNDPVNAGLPLESEGAKEKWFGGRFDSPSNSDSIDSDLAVQQYGGGENNSKTGRVEDAAGLMFQISTLHATSATLKFDWKTYNAENGDRFIAGYYVGTIDFAGQRYKDFVATFGSGTAAKNWWSTDWTEITRGIGEAWRHVSVNLPLNKPNIWVAFWIDASEKDYAKIDNIKVDCVQQIPEPSTLLLAAMGMVGCLFAQRKVRARRSQS